MQKAKQVSLQVLRTTAKSTKVKEDKNNLCIFAQAEAFLNRNITPEDRKGSRGSDVGFIHSNIVVFWPS
jgi:hypothetical protein